MYLKMEWALVGQSVIVAEWKGAPSMIRP